MSFLSVLKEVGKDLLMVDQVAAPIVGMFNPAAGAAMTVIGKLVVKAETTYTGEKQGTTKKQVVMDEFIALFPMFQQILRDQAGYELTVDSSAISSLIDATVSQFNAAKLLHDSFKLTKVTT